MMAGRPKSRRCREAGSRGSAIILTVVLTSLLAIVGVLFVMAARIDKMGSSAAAESRELNSAVDTLVAQIIETGLRLMSEKHDLGQLKVIARSIKEMRYAYRIFNHYKEGPCISIFGSARTPENHPDYIAAKEFPEDDGTTSVRIDG